MSAIYAFESTNIRVLGTPQNPLFVSTDICAALGFKNGIDAIKTHVDLDDLFKVQIDTAGGKQTVNAVNESGMYALIFGSKLPAAKRFKKWVTSEVLPAIRKTGTYAADGAKLAPANQYAIRCAVKRRAKTSAIHYQTIYNALYDHFCVASYKDLSENQIKEALAFIETCDLIPQGMKTLAVPDGSLVLSGNEVEQIRIFIYEFRYLYRKELSAFYSMLQIAKSPLAGRFYDVMTSLNLALLERTLERQGFSVRNGNTQAIAAA